MQVYSGCTTTFTRAVRRRGAKVGSQRMAPSAAAKERLNTLRDEAEGMARGIRIDATAPIKRYYHGATTMLDQGRKHAAARDWERAYVLLMRFVTFFLERMPEHPDFKGKSTATQHRSLKNDVKVRLPPLTPVGGLGAHHVTTRPRQMVLEEISMIKNELLAGYTREAEEAEQAAAAAAMPATTSPAQPAALPEDHARVAAPIGRVPMAVDHGEPSQFKTICDFTGIRNEKRSKGL